MKRKVLIVGSSGPLGRTLERELVPRGLDLTTVSRSGQFDSHQMDATDARQSRWVLQTVRPAIVIYLARPALDATAGTAAAIDSAVASLRTFAVECEEAGVDRLVFASSAAVYGTSVATPRSENEEMATDSPYATLKVRSEGVLAEIAAESHLTVLSLRIFNVYGPGFDSSLVNRLAIGEGDPPHVHDTEHFVRDYIHASDVGQAFVSALETREPESGALNVGTGIGTSNRTLLQLPIGSDYIASRQPVDASFSIADIAHIQNSWGFEPQVTLEKAFRDRDRYFSS